MTKYKYEFEVLEDFEPGNCYDCPLHYDEWIELDDDGWYEMECNTNCPVGTWDNCPLIKI